MRKFIVCSVIAVMLLGLSLAALPVSLAPVQTTSANPGTGWLGKYYNNPNLEGAEVASRIDDQINFDWGDDSPFPGTVPVDGFSARWTATVNFPSSGLWTFRVSVDDGARLKIDQTMLIDEWHGSEAGYTTYENSIGQLTAGNHDLTVEYYDGGGRAAIIVEWFAGSDGGGDTSGGGSAPPTGTVYGPGLNWNGQYFNNPTLTGNPTVTRTDNDINFNWQNNAPAAGIPADNFSVRWTTTFNFPSAPQWHFKVGADDGVRLWIDSTIVVDEWHGVTQYTVYENDVFQLSAGNHTVKVEYYDATGLAGVQVRWWAIGGETGGGTSGAPAVVAPNPVWAAVTADTLNVRTGPGRGNPVITQIVYPDNYLVLGITPDFGWVKIELDGGGEGWVSNEWVWLWSRDDEFMHNVPLVDEPVAPPAPLVEPDPTGLRIILNGASTDTLNLRTGPSVYTGEKIGVVPQNATFTVEAKNSNGAWYLINYQGVRGWVSALYVRLLDGEPRDLVVSGEVLPEPPPGTLIVPEDPTGNPAVTVRGRATTNLRLRSGPSILNTEQIGSVPQNAEFVIEVRTEGGSWYRITWEGQVGWVNAAYITLLEGRVADIPVQ
ncbi:MAG: SH3 domain-containing protein [Chloroflexi bacterium]|nr:SH3 domain-containing protein [Chloroflexota bacterium]